ncbi:MAG: tellurium resistance protein TerC [Methylococcales bacterium]|nr:tellurium resistance protein TerC [Methylococcales bacterium]
MGVSLAFACFIYFIMGLDSSILFLTGWGLEKVLAIDNLVVFSAIFSYFGIKDKYQHKVLYFGVLGAIILRLLFVSIGIGISDMFGSVSDILFGLIILYTAWLMYASDDDDEPDYSHIWYINLTKKWLPVTEETKKDLFFINGKATVFLFALIAIEISDIIFAFDSVPTIISVTKDPFLVYSSMMFAILGLRSMYFVLSALTRNLEYFELAVIIVLLCIAAKLLLAGIIGLEITPLVSFVSVLGILTAGVIISKIKGQYYEV